MKANDNKLTKQRAATQENAHRYERMFLNL